MPYLTPDHPPEDTICRVLRIPNDLMWLSIVNGALSELTREFRFEEFGTATPTETAERFQQMYDDFQLQGCDDMSGCCYDTVETRVTSDGAIEISINGGAWQPSPSDPRTTGVSLPAPTLDDHHTKCDAATNGRQHIEDMNLAHSEALASSTTVLELVTAIAAILVALLFAPEAAPVLIPILLATVPALFALGQTAFDAYWVSDNYDIVLCALYCNILEDGTFDDTAFSAVLADIGTQLPSGVPRDMLYRDLVAIGKKGLNNLCSYGASADADCSGCCGTCDTDLWAIRSLDGEDVGIEISRTSTYIEIQGHSHHSYGGVNYVAQIITDDANHCCAIDHVESVVGSEFAGFFANDCGVALPAGAPPNFKTLPQTDTYNTLEFRDTDPFTIKVFLA